MFTNLKLPTVLVVLLIICAGTLAAVLAYFQTTVKGDFQCRADYLDKVNNVLIQRNDITEAYFDSQDRLTEGFANVIFDPKIQTNPKESAAALKAVFAAHDKDSAKIKADREAIKLPVKPSCVVR